MTERSVVIVGGGIAGLSAGCYARMNGYRATILEMNKIPGGLCTAWKRKGYTFDISMHMLVGSKSGPFHEMWKELGAVQNRKFHYHDEIARIEGKDHTFFLNTDAERMKRQMLEISPADEKLIREFVSLICGRSLMGSASLTPQELMSPLDSAKMLVSLVPHVPKFFRYDSKTIQDFAERFKHPFLRRAVRMCIDSPSWPMVQFPMVAMAGICTSWAKAGVPIGGSQAVVFDIADRFQKLGGELRCMERVEDVLIESDRAVGIRLVDGSEVRADSVIWAADGHTVIFDILGGRYVNDAVRTVYERWIPVRSLVHVCLGVNRDLSKEPAKLAFELDDPITVAGETRRWIGVLHHCFDPTMAPPGKSAVEVWYPSDYEWWEKLYERRDEYKAEKERIADLTIALLDKRWPGFSEDVEVVDVPTPATYVRYTGNWQGSTDGWYVTPDNMKATPLLTLPGLSEFYMAGQWTVPFAGTVTSALTGRQVIQHLCTRDGVPFATDLD